MLVVVSFGCLRICSLLKSNQQLQREFLPVERTTSSTQVVDMIPMKNLSEYGCASILVQ